MKVPLHYQLSEYDCGPTTLLNAVSYLFAREEIPPEIIRNVMLYSLDCYSREGAGRAGTSRMAMMFLANWLDGFGRATDLPLSTQYLAGKSVYIGQQSQINDALHRGGVAVVRLIYDVEHYVLLTGDRDGYIYMFDPWYLPEDSNEFAGQDITITLAHPQQYNRIVPYACFNQLSHETNYSLGPIAEREAVLLFNTRTQLSAQDTIEYFI